jgi:hypothetical protein
MGVIAPKISVGRPMMGITIVPMPTPLMRKKSRLFNFRPPSI